MNTLKMILIGTSLISAVVLLVGVLGYCALLLHMWCLRRNHHRERTVPMVDMRASKTQEEYFSTDSETDAESSGTDLGSSEDW